MSEQQWDQFLNILFLFVIWFAVYVSRSHGE